MIKDFSNSDYKSKVKVKKDYQKKKFVNPYFDKKVNIDRGFNTKFYLKILGVVLILYILIYSNFLRINNIEVQGTDMIRQDEFRQTVENRLNDWRWYLFPQRNLLLMSKSKLSRGITEKYSLNSLKIDRGWKSIKIIIEERASHIIVFNNQNFYFLNQDGAINRQISKQEAEQYWDRFPVLNIGERNVNIGDEIASKEIAEFILKLDEEIRNSSLDIHGYELREEEELSLVAKAGWRAYFDINTDIKLSVENLILVLDEKVDNQSNLEYIDLRFGNKVFYK